MYLFETFEPGRVIGTRSLTLDRDLVESWLALFPDDRDGDRMPVGMIAAVYSRAYSDILLPRPPGNVHGAQRFQIARLPSIGDRLITDLSCESKELRSERRWIRFGSETRREDGTLLFTGLMTTLWAK
ncbi:MAG: hypothetical protein ACRED3_03285 [Bradyrhizobium sp.]